MNQRKNTCFLLIALVSLSFAQQTNAQEPDYSYSASNLLPFGSLNPDAPNELRDYSELIGICDCKSIKRTKDETWAAPVDMQWTFKYIMNGTAIQDESLKLDGTYSGSIRQFNKDSLRWYVHYYSSQNVAPELASWQGGQREHEIVLFKKQKAPNGAEGFYKIRFYDISENGFNWLGAWISKEEDFIYETWKIECRKRKL
jgi:hypothetical protein